MEEVISGISIPAYKPTPIYIRCQRSASNDPEIIQVLDKLRSQFGAEVPFKEVLKAFHFAPHVAFCLLSEATLLEDAQRLAAHAGLRWAAALLPYYEQEFAHDLTPRDGLNEMSNVLLTSKADATLTTFYANILWERVNAANGYFVSRSARAAVYSIQRLAALMSLPARHENRQRLSYDLHNLTQKVLLHFSRGTIHQSLSKLITP